MTKALNQYNFYNVRLTGSAFLTNALLLRLNTEQPLSTSISDMSIFCATELLSWEKSGKCRNEVPYELPFCNVAVYLFMHVSIKVIRASLFSRTCRVTLYYCRIPNEFGILFELGVQRLETLGELEIQYSQVLASEKQFRITGYL